jgi:flagellar basal body-associated protein FliL
MKDTMMRGSTDVNCFEKHYAKGGLIMGSNEAEILGKAVEKTQSDLIVFFVILVIALVVVLIPVYSLTLKERKEKNRQEIEREKQYIEREKQLIQVITASTDVMASLKVTLETSGVATASGIEHIKTKMSRIEDKLDSMSAEESKATHSINKILDESAQIADTGNNILRIVEIASRSAAKGDFSKNP